MDQTARRGYPRELTSGRHCSDSSLPGLCGFAGGHRALGPPFVRAASLAAERPRTWVCSRLVSLLR
jgi:hypothetical protein